MRLYVIAFSMLVIVTALLTVKDVAIGLLFLTLGLGFPLLFAPTGLIYMLCLLPAVAAWSSRNLRWPAIGASLFLVTLVAVAPGIVSRMEAEKIVTAVEHLDRRPDRLSASRTMEIIRPAALPYDSAFPSEACPEECRHLLVSGQMDWIRVSMMTQVTNNSGRSRDEVQASTFFAAMGEKCKIGDAGATPETKRCVLTGASSRDKAGLTVEITQSATRPGGGTALTRQNSTRRLSISALVTGIYQTQYVQTESSIATTFMPLVIGPEINGMSSSGLQIMTSDRRHNQISFRCALASFGYRFEGIEAVIEKPRSYRDNLPPSEGLTLEVLSILDLPGTAPFNQQQMDAINKWVTQARGFGRAKDAFPLNESAEATLKRLIEDRRVRYVSFLDQVLYMHPEVLERLVPAILSSLEQGDRPSDVSKSAARSLRVLDTRVLAPYAARINQIRRQHFQQDYDPLAGTVIKFGVNPVPLLPLTAEDRDYNSKLDALCRGEKTWSTQISTAVIAYAQGLTPRSVDLRQKLAEIEYVVTRHGGWDDLIQLYTTRFPDQLKGLSLRRSRMERHPDRCH